MALRVVHEISLPDCDEDIDVTSTVTVRIPKRNFKQTVQFIPGKNDFIDCDDIPLESGWSSAKTYNGSPVPGWSYGRVVAADSNGNYWIGGNFYNGKLKFGDIATLDATGKYCAFVAKFSPANVPLFVMKVAGIKPVDLPNITGIAIDSGNNVWFQGIYQGGVDIGGIVLTSVGRTSLFLVKLTSSGQIVVVKYSTNKSNITPTALAVDSSNNVYSVGTYTGDLSIGGLSFPNSMWNDVFVCKFASNGTAVDGNSSSYASNHFAIANGIVLDSTGNIYITGNYTDSVKFGSTTLSSGGAGNFFIAKLDSNLCWQLAVSGVFTGGSNPYAVANDIAMDGSNNIYITGKFQTGAGGSLILGPNRISSVPYDTFVAQLDTSLVFGSGNQGFTDGGVGYALARDNTGSVWATGTLRGPNCNFSGIPVNSSNSNFYLVKLNSTCVFSELTTGAASSGMSAPIDITIDSSNRIILTGSINGNVSFGSKNASGSGNTFVAATYVI